MTPMKTRSHPHARQVDPLADEIAIELERQGEAPVTILRQSKARSGQKNLTYKPHQGARERARRAARLATIEARS